MARVPDPDLAERRRQQILDAALSCFLRRGFHQAGMQEICAEAGLSAGAVYRYFPSKSEIIGAIVEEYRGRAGEFLSTSAEAPIKELILGLYCQMAQSLSGARASLFGEVISEAARDAALAERLRIGKAEAHEALAARIGQAVARGELRSSVDPAASARLIQAFFDGVMLHMPFMTERDQKLAERDAAYFLDRVLGDGEVCAKRSPTAAKTSTATV